MRKFFSFLGLALCVAATLLALQHRAPKHSKNAGLEKATSASAAHASMQYGKLPLSFEPNLGQSSPEAKYLAHGDGYSLFLTSNEAVLVLGSSSKSKTSSAARADVLRMQLVGANSSATFSAIDQLPGKANYFRGRNPSAWHTNVPTYRKVAEEGIYPGVDLVYYGTQRQLEYDFIVAPGADIAPIRLSIQGGKNLQIDNQGELVVSFQGGDVVLHKPVVYQQVGNEKQMVAANYGLDANHDVRFEIGNYDRSRALVIDPILAYSTYLGGSNIDGAYAIAVAPDDTAFVTGGTFSTDFPTTHQLQPNHGGPDDFYRDAFVTKFSADGSTILYSTYLGGKNEDDGYGIAVDDAGDAYVTGKTQSPDFPITIDAVNTLCGGDGKCGASFNSGNLLVFNGFLSKLNPAGTVLLYSTFIGNYENVIGFAVAVDQNQIAYVTGSTTDVLVATVTIMPPAPTPQPFPVTTTLPVAGTCPPVPVPFGGGPTDAFVMTISSTGSSILYSTFLGGDGEDAGYGIAADKNGDAYVTGLTYSPASTTPPGVICSSGVSAGGSGYLIGDTGRITTGNGLATYTVLSVSSASPTSPGPVTGFSVTGGSGYALGPSQPTATLSGTGTGFTIDVTGVTVSITSPPVTPGAFQATYAGAGDAFFTELNTNVSSPFVPVYFTYFGGAGLDQGNGIAVDSRPASCTTLPSSGTACNVYIAGGTGSGELGSSPIQSDCKGESDTPPQCEGDAFVAEFNPNLSGNPSRVFFTYLGGSLADSASGVALDQSGNIYVAGSTVSPDFPVCVNGTSPGCSTTAGPAFQATYGGGNDDAFVAEIEATSHLLHYSSYLGGTDTDNAYGIAVDASNPASAYVAGQTCSTNFPVSNPEQVAPGGDCDAFVSKVTILNGIQINPSSLTFPAQSLGTTSATETVTITNGDLPITALSVATPTGPGAGEFAETTTCPPALNPGGQCTITVTFTPTAPGVATASITVTDTVPPVPPATAPTTETKTISLTGTASTLTLSASSLNFGTVPVGTTSAPQTLTATNDGTTAITFSSITASGDYAETDNCTKAPVQPTTTCTIQVTYTPTATGASVGSLTINDNAPGSPQVVLLNGSGIVQNFTLTATTNAAVIPAGKSANFGLLITPIAGFSQPVTLSCGGLPPGAQCLTSQNPVTLSGPDASNRYDHDRSPYVATAEPDHQASPAVAPDGTTHVRGLGVPDRHVHAADHGRVQEPTRSRNPNACPEFDAVHGRVQRRQPGRCAVRNTCGHL